MDFFVGIGMNYITLLSCVASEMVLMKGIWGFVEGRKKDLIIVRGKNLYPEGHPYSWTVIGSLPDLQAATLDDVKEFYHK